MISTRRRICRLLLGLIFFGAFLLLLYQLDVRSAFRRRNVLGMDGNASTSCKNLWGFSLPCSLTNQDGGGGSTEHRSENEQQRFLAALSARADPADRWIVLALVDEAFIDMAVNLYETSFRRHGIENFLFVGVGHRTCEILGGEPLRLSCFHYANDTHAEVASVYRSVDFLRKMNLRTDMILDALAAGYVVLHVDLDVVFLANPLVYLRRLMTSSSITSAAHPPPDIATMLDSSAYNAGFIVVRPTRNAIAVYELTKKITIDSPTIDDQTALNSAIKEMSKKNKTKMTKKDAASEFRALALNRGRYVCGVAYFERSKRWFPTAAGCPKCEVVHNNWIVGREAKVYRFREHLMWMYDKNGYYSSRASRYLAYGNPPFRQVMTANESAVRELRALRNALAVGEILDRIVILPRFHCFTFDTFECPLNGILDMTAFDGVFSGRYRENSFLEHPKVPGDVKLNRSASYRFLRSSGVVPPAEAPSSAKTVVFKQDRVTEGDVRRWFRDVGEKILVFHSLYGDFDFSTDAEIDEKYSKAFHRCDYRQLKCG